MVPTVAKAHEEPYKSILQLNKIQSRQISHFFLDYLIFNCHLVLLKKVIMN